MLVVGVIVLGRLKGAACCRISLIVGYIMLLIGGFPWLYTGLLVGGRPGNEGAGMLGTIIFILVGLPGIAITVTALILRARQSKKENCEADK